MKSLPLPIRLAAGLAATAVERVSKLPEGIAGFPVTVASQALQFSMRVQQHVTELAIKGDEALASFRPVEDKPEWATFDEDEDSSATPGAEVHEFLRREAKPTREPEFSRDAATPPAAGPASVAHPVTEEPSAVHPHPAVGAATEAVARPKPAAVPKPAVGPRPEITPDPTVAPEPVAESPVRPADVHEPEPSPAASTSEASAPAGVTRFDEMSVAQLRGKLRTLSLQQLEELLEYERAHSARERFVTMLANRVRTVRESDH